jgi:hypothetical protein
LFSDYSAAGADGCIRILHDSMLSRLGVMACAAPFLRGEIRVPTVQKAMKKNRVFIVR